MTEAEVIRILRDRFRETGERQRDIAERVHISHKGLNEKLNGKYPFKLCDFLAVCDALGLEIVFRANDANGRRQKDGGV